MNADEEIALDEAARQFPEPGDPGDWLRVPDGHRQLQQVAATREAYLAEPGDMYLQEDFAALQKTLQDREIGG